MPTFRQKRVADLIIQNSKLDNPLNGGEMLDKVRYGKISKQPSRILKSEGVKQALKEKGFTEDNAKKVVENIMLNEKVDPNTRLKATDQVFKVQGSYAPERHLTLNIDVSQEELEIADKALQDL